MAKTPEDDSLNERQAAFVREYLVDFNASQAAIRAGYSEKTARSISSELLTKPDILSAIAKGQELLARRTEITQEKVLERYWQIATADPNALIEFRRRACKACWPEEPSRKDVNASCEGCDGEGVGYAHGHDSRRLSGPAKLLYAGVKQTKDGLEIKMHDQLAALNMVAKHIGMFVDRQQQLDREGNPTDPVAPVLNIFIDGKPKTD